MPFKRADGRPSRLMLLGLVLVILGPILEVLQQTNLLALGAPPWVAVLVTALGAVVMRLRAVTTQPLEAKATRESRRTERRHRLPLGVLLAVALAGLMASCGPRLCKLVEIIPDGKGGATVSCDGEPWGIGQRFEDQRKCVHAKESEK